jgi:tetratricopeptide (TPR) repeat protein
MNTSRVHAVAPAAGQPLPRTGRLRWPLAALVLAMLLAAASPAPVAAQQARRGVIARVLPGGGAGDVLMHPDVNGQTCDSCHGGGGTTVVRGTTLPAGPFGQPTTDSASSQPTSAAATKPVTKVSDCLELYNKGDYASAAEGYKKFLGEKDSLIAASIGLARALQMKGDYQEAIDALARAKEAGAADADWQVEMAEALSNVGRYEDALPHAQRACEIRADWPAAIFCLGELLETLGRKDLAVEAYKAMEKVMDKDDWKHDARSLVAMGKILDHYSILTSKKASAQGDNIYKNYLQTAYLKVDEKYWPAYVAAGMFALSKHRPNMATSDFLAAAKINRHIPDVHIGLGLVSVSRMDFERAIGEANEALRINPHLPDAHLLKAIAMMTWRKHLDAVPDIEAALATNPNDPEALALMASVYYCVRQPEKAQPFIQRVEKVNPRSADLYNTIGQWLSSIRQFDDAEKQFLKAIELAPEMSEPPTNLGLLYMQTGEETKARAALDKAHELDDYRDDVVNYLQVLDKLSRFQTRETEHFIVKVDPENDAVLLNQVSDYMEGIYPEIVSDYAYPMPNKVLIEIFPTQGGFSTRITGQGWIPTVGACTGKVIVLAAPSPQEERTPLGTHNWAVVLRHEFTHAVTLGATENRIPHWFTEACAVWQQPDKQAYEHVQILVSATRGGMLYGVQDLDWGFIRPRPLKDRRLDPRHLAYAQSEWAIEFLIAAKGYDVVPQMLKGFRDGLSQAEVFDKIVGMSEKEFDKAFGEWAHKTIKEWGYNPEPVPEVPDAQKAAEARPADPNAQAAYAVALYYAGGGPNALAAADKALALDANNVRALGVKAFVLDTQKKYDDALDAANRLEQLDHNSFASPRVLADCYLNMKGDQNALEAKAIAALELLQARQPLDKFSYVELARIYTSLGMSARALPNLVHLHRHTMNDPKYARAAAEIYRSMKQYDQALNFFREVVHINPYDATAYEAIASLEVRAKKYDKAVDAAKDITLLQPNSAKAWAVLANVRLSAGRAASSKDELLQARSAAEKSISLDADGPGKDILENIAEALKGP